jgi:hypothetical protein
MRGARDTQQKRNAVYIVQAAQSVSIHHKGTSTRAPVLQRFRSRNISLAIARKGLTDTGLVELPGPNRFAAWKMLRSTKEAASYSTRFASLPGGTADKGRGRVAQL